MNTKIVIIITAVVNGLFFALPFLYDYLLFLLFFAFTFLFYNQEKIQKNSDKIMYLVICISIWQFIILYWFHSSQSSFWGVNAIILLSVCVLVIILSTFFLVLIPLNSKWKYVIFCVIWIGYEIFWLKWEITYPMFSLGVILGNFPFIIQWYSITGIIGGSLWILSVNFLLLKLLKKEQVSVWNLTLLLPLLISVCVFLEENDESSSINAIAINNKLQEKNGVDEVLMLLREEIDENTNMIICPEGLLNLPASSIPVNSYFSEIKRMLISQSPDAILVCGSNVYEFTANTDNSIVHNVALLCDTSGFVTFRNKKTLVPFGETIPYEKYLGKIDVVKNSVNVPITYNPNYDQLFKYKNFNILPLICYELYFSNVIRAYYKNASIGVICCISHEYSVPNKTYYKQFLRMSRIQAITFKTPVVKSTINGYSSLIDSKGNIISSGYNTNEVVEGLLSINNKETLYARYGYLPVIMTLVVLSPLLRVKKASNINNKCACNTENCM